MEIAPAPVESVEEFFDDDVIDAEQVLPAVTLIEAVPPPVAKVEYAPARPAPPTADDGSLEQTLGLKLAGWVGALVVVIGVALAAKYAYDAGWLAATPPAVRLATLFAGSVALVVAGEWARMKVGDAAAVGLTAAGVATLFLDAYAGWAVLGVYGRDGAFALMAGVAVLGSIIAARGRLASVAVLSLVGGHVAPLVAGGDAESSLPLWSYVLMLTVVGASLAWWGASARWRALRWLAVAATALWSLGLILAGGPVGVALTFVIVYAVVLLGEVVLSAMRPQPGRPGDPAAWSEDALLVVIVAGLLAGGTLLILRDAEPFARAAWLVGYAGAFASLWLLLRRTMRGVMLSVAALAVGAALVVAAAPVALGGPALVLTWAAMSLAFAFIAARSDANGPRAAAVVVWSLAALYLAWKWTTLDADAAVGLSSVIGLTGLAIAFLLDSEKGRPAARGMAVAGAVAFAAGCVVGLPGAFATLAVVGLAWLLLGLDVLRPRLMLAELGVAALTVAAVKWAAVDLLARRLDAGWTAGQLSALPVLNPLTGLGAFIAGSFPAAYWLRLRGREWAGAGSMVLPTLVAVAAVIVAFGLTLEVDRVVSAAEADGWTNATPPGQAQQLGFTALWTLCVAAAGAGLFKLAADPPTRRLWLIAPAVLLSLLAAKFVGIDSTFWHLFGRASQTPLLNPEFFAGLLLALACGGAWAIGRRGFAFALAGFASLVVVLWLGMLEIDRGLRNTGVAFGFALTGWWSTLAVTLIVAGLALHIKGMRYFALALFAATLVKLFAVDLQQLDRGPRTLAFVVVGLLLLGTSVLYGRSARRK